MLAQLLRWQQLPISRRLGPISRRLGPINRRLGPINRRPLPINRRLLPIGRRLGPIVAGRPPVRRRRPPIRRRIPSIHQGVTAVLGRSNAILSRQQPLGPGHLPINQPLLIARKQVGIIRPRPPGRQLVARLRGKIPRHCPLVPEPSLHHPLNRVLVPDACEVVGIVGHQVALVGQRIASIAGVVALLSVPVTPLSRPLASIPARPAHHRHLLKPAAWSASTPSDQQPYRLPRHLRRLANDASS
jgi:hypothetical protein